METTVVSTLAPVIGLGATLVLSLSGLAVGGIARQCFPVSLRRTGGIVLAVASVAAYAGLILFTITNPAQVGMWVLAVVICAMWIPGFVAASLGANRWVLLASVIAGYALQIAVEQIISFELIAPSIA